MGYSKEIYHSALEQLNQRRMENELETEERKAAFFATCPRAQEIEHQLANTAIAALFADQEALSGQTIAKATRIQPSTATGIRRPVDSTRVAFGLFAAKVHLRKMP